MADVEELNRGIPVAYWSEERAAIQETAREFAQKEVLPVANQLDPVQGEIPAALREKMGELGFFGVLMPEEYGGLGLGVFEYCLVTEELARGLDERGQYHRPRQPDRRAPSSRSRTATRPSGAWPGASFSAPTRCPSRAPAPTSPASAAAPNATAPAGSSTARKCG